MLENVAESIKILTLKILLNWCINILWYRTHSSDVV